MTPPPAPAPGRFEGGVHLFPVRVYYEDTDAAGVVYHASYLQFAERARTEMLRGAGLHQSQLLAEEGIAFVVRQCIADFFLPARLDDGLIVASRMMDLRGASLDLEQIVRRGDADLVRLQVKLACLALATSRAVRIPPQLMGAFAQFAAPGG